MNNLNWIFDGIGTEIISLIGGIILGAAGEYFYLKLSNRQKQKAGDNSYQVIGNAPNTTTGDYISGDKIIHNDNNLSDEFDIRNFTKYNSSQIENVIFKGNDVTRRKWCLELIMNQKQDYLINDCINRMTNEKEKFTLLKDLSERGYAESEYFAALCKSLLNGVYITKTIDLLIGLEKFSLAEEIFNNIENNKYKLEALKSFYSGKKDLFEKIYKSGKCFNNISYVEKMKKWLEFEK